MKGKSDEYLKCYMVMKIAKKSFLLTVYINIDDKTMQWTVASLANKQL